LALFPFVQLHFFCLFKLFFRKNTSKLIYIHTMPLIRRLLPFIWIILLQFSNGMEWGKQFEQFQKWKEKETIIYHYSDEPIKAYFHIDEISLAEEKFISINDADSRMKILEVEKEDNGLQITVEFWTCREPTKKRQAFFKLKEEDVIQFGVHENQLLYEVEENNEVQLIGPEQDSLVVGKKMSINDTKNAIILDIFESADVIIKKIIVPQNVSENIERMRDDISDQIFEKMKLSGPLQEEIRKELDFEKEFDTRGKKLADQYDKLHSEITSLNQGIQFNLNRQKTMEIDIDDMKKEIFATKSALEFAKSQNNNEMIAFINAKHDGLLQKISNKELKAKVVKELVVEQKKWSKNLYELAQNTIKQISAELESKNERSTLVNKKFDKAREHLKSLRELTAKKPGNCIFAERFPLEFWAQFLIDNTPLLIRHNWGDWKQFHKTTEDKKWLKESLTEVCPKNVLEYVWFGSMEYGQKTTTENGTVIILPTLNDNGIPLLLIKLKEEITKVLNTWGSKGFIIKPTRGCMSEGNIFVKKNENGYTTKTVDRARSNEKSYKYFTSQNDLIEGIYEMIKNPQTWEQYHFLEQISGYTSYATLKDLETHILVERLMDIPNNWFFPFELRITLLYRKPLVIWIITNHSEYLIVWRADNPKFILHWEATHFLNKSPLSTEEFYDDNLIFYILKVSTILGQHYNLVYGRIDIFTAKRKDNTCKFDWYVNEVQNHGLEPENLSRNHKCGRRKRS